MAEVFISYKSQNRSRARELSAILEAEGFSVWWDREIRPGQDFSERIMSAIQQANVVICLWSKAVEVVLPDTWVTTEARIAKSRGVLVPIRLDEAVLPQEFGNLSHVQLDGVAFRREDEAVESLLVRVYHLARNQEPPARRKEVPQYADLSSIRALSPATAKAVASAEAGDRGGALYNLGLDIQNGMDGAPRDPELARRLIRAAANLGHVQAMWHLATMFSARQDGNKDDNLREAFRWYQEAAELGQPAAQYGLALAHHSGHGTDQQDSVKARYWLERAAHQGHANAQYVLGQFCEFGTGATASDPKAASKWYLRAAIQGVAGASLGLAELFRRKQVAADIDAMRILYCFALAAAQRDLDRDLAITALSELGASDLFGRR